MAATRPATPCCARWRSGWRLVYAAATRSRGWGVTSSRPSWRTARCRRGACRAEAVRCAGPAPLPGRRPALSHRRQHRRRTAGRPLARCRDRAARGRCLLHAGQGAAPQPRAGLGARRCDAARPPGRAPLGHAAAAGAGRGAFRPGPAARAAGAGRRRAVPGDHRDGRHHAHGRRGPLHHADAGPGRAHRAGRLRRGRVVVQLPQGAAGGPVEDRRPVRARAADRPAGPGGRAQLRGRRPRWG